MWDSWYGKKEQEQDREYWKRENEKLKTHCPECGGLFNSPDLVDTAPNNATPEWAPCLNSCHVLKDNNNG